MIPSTYAHQPRWNAYQFTIRVGRKTYEWVRFGPDAVTAVASAQRACADEWPTRDSRIIDWREIPDPRP